MKKFQCGKKHDFTTIPRFIAANANAKRSSTAGDMIGSTLRVLRRMVSSNVNVCEVYIMVLYDM